MRRWPNLRLAAALLPIAATVVVAAAATVVAVGPGALPASAAADYVQYVNPFVGTRPGGPDFGTGGGSGNTFPGADAPFGMVQWSPDTVTTQHGGYFYDDNRIRDFSLTHFSGAGCSAAEDIPIMPYPGTVTTSPQTDASRYWSTFSHGNEAASAGYYRVNLDSGARAELTATTRSGMGRFGYPAGQAASVLFKVSGSINGVSDSQVNIDPAARTVSGYAASGGFCGGANTYKVYFSASFDRPFASLGTWNGGTVTTGSVAARGSGPALTPQATDKRTPTGAPTARGPVTSTPVPQTHPDVLVSGTGVGGFVTFDTAAGTQVDVRVGVSYVSVANAQLNATTEQAGRSFDQVRQATRDAWNQRLSAIAVTGGTADQLRIFYTALYHCLLQPNVFSDVNGQYPRFGPGRDNPPTDTVPAGHAAYANFSGWDVYRSEMQLLALVAPAEAADIAQTMLANARATGDVWDRWSQNNDFQGVMVGDPYASIVASVYAFGATGFDATGALASLVKDATTVNLHYQEYYPRPGLAQFQYLGYLPAGASGIWGPTSTHLEYDSADFGIAALARRLGDTATYQRFMARAQNWRNLFNPANRYIQPRNTDGSWPSFSPGSSGPYVEGNGAQYHWMVPFNVRALFDAMGGYAAAVSRLDAFFHDPTGAWQLNAGPNQPYAYLGNEPTLQTPWLYDYAGAPYKTQATVRQAVNTLYRSGPDGEVGNDDLGETSSAYVWGALGMYPVVPGRAELALASPLFPAVTITRPSGQTIQINAPGAAAGTFYVQSLSVNGAASTRPWLPESFVADGGTLDYTLGTSPNTGWGAGPADAPPSFRDGEGSPDNVGVSDDTNRAAADYDGHGFSYSAQALAAAGVRSGGTLDVNGITFGWPAAGSGVASDLTAHGQTVAVSGSGSISFLGSATNGPSTGTAVVNYTDGSSQQVPVTLSDWTLNAGSAQPTAGEAVVAATPYRNSQGGGTDNVATYLLASAPRPLAAGRQVASVTLPAATDRGKLHVFAVGVGTVTNLALNRPATGTASCTSTETPDKAVNGSVSGGNSDKWCSGASPRWLRVDLGSAWTVRSFTVRHAGAGGEQVALNTRAFTVEVSTDGSLWTTVVTVTTNTVNVTSHPVAAVQARYVRLNVTTPTQIADNAARIYELEVYG